MALLQRLFDAIVDGKAQLALSLVEEELSAGAEPMALIAETMIPAMDEVGKLFQEEEYFVPELMLSGRAMKAAMEPLRPLLAAKGAKPAGMSSPARSRAICTTSARTSSSRCWKARASRSSTSAPT